MRFGFAVWAVWATMVRVAAVSRTVTDTKNVWLPIRFTKTPFDVDLSLTIYGRRIVFQRGLAVQRKSSEQCELPRLQVSVNGSMPVVDLSMRVRGSQYSCIVSTCTPGGTLLAGQDSRFARVGTVSKIDRRKALLALERAAAEATIPTGPHAISDVRTYAVPLSGTGSSYVVLPLRTQSGLAGYGECKELSGADLKATSEAVLRRAASAYESLRPLVPTGAESTSVDDGFCALPKGPGPRVEVNEEELERNQIT
jgi:hypothetical protein